MKRVLVIGCSGSGKTTLSCQLASKVGLPLHHLDNLYWKPGWIESDYDEFIEKQAAIVAGDRWIIDGNYSGSLETRLPRADVVILLEMGTFYCLWNIVRRYLRFRNQTRPDMGGDNRERMSLEFFHYVATFKRTRLPGTLQLLESYANSFKLIVLKSPSEVNQFVENLS